MPVAASRLLNYKGTKVGYVELTSFTDGSGDEVRSQVQKMLHEGARALILDLRENGGGLLNEAVNVASVFIPDGHDRLHRRAGAAPAGVSGQAQPDAIAPKIPMVVLVDRGTASAAEIVTGALQDRGRAKVVGTHTYGKGVFQEIEPLSNGGALDFTVGEYFTPNGRNLGGRRGQAGHGHPTQRLRLHQVDCQDRHRAHGGREDRRRRAWAVTPPPARAVDPRSGARVALLVRQGKFLVAEPFFGPGPRLVVTRDKRAGVGDLVVLSGGGGQGNGRRGGSRRATVAQRLGPTRGRARRDQGADARSRAPGCL